MKESIRDKEFVQKMLAAANQRNRLKVAMEAIERITWREGNTIKEADAALIDIRREAKAALGH